MKDNIAQDDIYLGLGSKYTNKSILFDVDYIFAFNVETNETNTIVSWNIAVINFDLYDIFKPLLNTENKLQGKITLNSIYTIL